MIHGVTRLEGLKHSGYVRKKATPVLLAIDPRNYIDSMGEGVEPGEIEIKGKIDFDDVVAVDSLDKLLEVAPHLIERAYFEFHYIGMRRAKE
ncbi:MAG: hypothetical protein HY514_05220 [Candidatus Aenigmarchaeota archaeon]|nr:hypothetical protein [Candidatus Aenigmarchaeota archaeon]